MVSKKELERFNDLYDRYHPLVRGVLFNMVGGEVLEDLTQETFLKVWNGLPRFAFKSTLKTWVYRITINTALDHLRKKKVSTVEYLKEIDLQTKNAEIKAEQDMIQASLDSLDEESRSYVVLFYFEDLSIKDIAKTLEVPEGTVKSKLFYAKKKMKAFFNETGEEFNEKCS